MSYLRTADGLEVDFLGRYRDGAQELIQVCASLKAPETVERELRALAAAAGEHPRAKRRLLVLDRDAAGGIEAPGVEVLQHTTGCSPSPSAFATRGSALRSVLFRKRRRALSSLEWNRVGVTGTSTKKTRH